LAIIKNQIFSLWLMALLVISPGAFYAQTQHLSFHHLSPEEGLSQASNDYVYHDSKGFVWLSSIDGLNRFDGKQVKIYKSVPGDSTSLLGNIVTSNFFEDEESNLWFTTYEGLHCYIREQDHFRHFQIKNEIGEKIQQDYHVFHLDNQKQLWLRIGIGKTGQLYSFNIQKLTSKFLCPINGQRNYPVLDQEGQVKQVVSCLFFEKKGIEIIEIASSYKPTSYFTGDQKGIPSKDVHTIHLTKGSWYIGTMDGLLVFDPKTKEHKFFTTYEGKSIGEVRSSISISDQLLWVATSKKSVLYFDKRTNQFVGQIPQEPERKFGLKLKRVNRLYKDRQDNIWLSSTSTGVSYTNLNKRKFEYPSSFRGRNINAIFESKTGAIFCSYNGGPTAYYNDASAAIQFVPTVYPENISSERIQLFLEDEGDTLWAFTFSYLLKWDPAKLHFEYVKKLPGYSLSIHRNQTGRILLGTYIGIFECKKNNADMSFIPFSALKEYQPQSATTIHEDLQRRIYLALDASSLVILESDGNGYSELKRIEGIGYAKGFYEADKYLWVATSTGLLKIDKQDLSSQLLNEVEHGVPNESYYCIIPDEFDSFWLTCNKGIIRYFPESKSHRRYSLVDGLQANEFNTNAFLKTNKGEIWMGGIKGLNRFFPEDIQDLQQPPKVQITRLQVNDEPYKTMQQIGELSQLDLAYYNNTFSFDFVSLEYSDPKNNQLQYKLEGQEEGWVDAERNGFARYSNLAPGHYTFNVKAANSDGVWSDEFRRLNIYIATPWWKTWWFYTLCLFAIAGIVYGGSMYRLQQALKLERMRVKISSDLHDDVGGLLAGLMMQSEILETTASKERKPKLQRIGEMSRNAMSRMRDTVWAIDARKDKFENLLDRIREHAMETLEPKNIALELKVEKIPLDKKLPTHIRQNLYLICKEAITNAAKHSNGNRMQIHFTKERRNGILLKIHDNGKVDTRELKSTGLGMSNLKMRAAQIGGEITMDVKDGFLILIKIV